MGVKLRKRKNNDGTTTLFLDIYHNRKRNFEFLKDLKLLKADSVVDREENRQRLALAEKIRNKKEQELQADVYEVIPDWKKHIDFLEFFKHYRDRYNKKDKRVLSACLDKFIEFMYDEGIESLTTKKITETLVIDFKDYLEKTLHGESPSNYFTKFKRMLKHGVREKIFNSNPAEHITIRRGTSIKKDILDFEEIQLLASTPMTNKTVKSAFLFSCLTGLRYSDVIALKWKNIQGNILKINQAKTGKPATIHLNKNALELLGEAGKNEQFVFTLPTHAACSKNLRTWCKRAGIRKKITWHCARHSFATNIIFYGSDVNSASSLLGHSSLSYTQRYVRVVDSLKEKAVSNLPIIQL